MQFAATAREALELAAARGFLRLAKRVDVSSQPREYHGHVESCLGHQENVIERLRAVRAHETGKIALTAVPIPLAAVIESAAALM